MEGVSVCVCASVSGISYAFLLLYSDVIQIDKTAEYFRLLYDVKGRFTIHRITSEEAKVRMMKTCAHFCTCVCCVWFLCWKLLACVSALQKDIH